MLKINLNPKENILFNAFNVFFIVNSIQVGVGLTGFQVGVFMEAKQDAWISIILIGMVAHIVGFVMVRTLQKYESADLYGIHYDLFGKWISKGISLLIIIYFFAALSLITRAYTEILQAWLFPEFPTWLISLIAVLIIAYGVIGGIRVVVGVSVLSVLLTSWMLFLAYFPLQYVDWVNLQPIFNNPIPSVLKGAYTMSFTIVGFEIIYFIYPYIKEKKKTNKYMQLGMLYTNIIYLVLMVLAIIYFGRQQLLITIWPTLSFFKVVQFPFIERFEIIAITLWMIVVLPNTFLLAWAGSKGVKRAFNIKQKYGLYFFLTLVFVSDFLMQTHIQIDKVIKIMGQISFYITFVYPIFLYLFVIIKRKILKPRLK